jgi:hypothetical protein
MPHSLEGCLKAVNSSLEADMMENIIRNDDNITATATNAFLSDFTIPTLPTSQAPAWMINFVAFRKRIFLRVVEPVIVGILGPAAEYNPMSTVPSSAFRDAFSKSKNLLNQSSFSNSTALDSPEVTMHRRLSFLPDYVEDASSFRETSMSFATLITLFITMASILLIFLSCFYHNQKYVLCEGLYCTIYHC